MALYVLSDLHLSRSVEKPMDIFGGAWEGHMEKLEKGMEILVPDDTLVIPGDLSWGISLEEAAEDFEYLESLPGRKILVKGNHDLWWSTRAKMTRFLENRGIKSIYFLHNNYFMYKTTALCGTRGWFYEEEKGTEHDLKMKNREIIRLKISLDAAKREIPERILCFMHYPPIYGRYVCPEVCGLLEEYGVSECLYGHLHGQSHKMAFEGVKNGINYRLVSCDYVNFQPILLEQ
ncbi:MAG: serine/threonine protein phosphatase [Clostridiales bacterium]|jgi:predicted phosphohydrolase|nr:serine/threonine protein phosphatase [Clostridiales bacterium]